MPRTGAMEIIQGYVTAPSTTLTAVTVASGNSLTVRYTPGQPYLLDYWANNQGAGQLVIKSARLHDQVNGINPQVPATETFSLSGVFPQKLVPQDTLTVLLSGTATGAAIEHVCLQVYYDNLPGSNGIFLRKSELFRFGLFEMTSEITITGLTSGEWGTARAINASQDVFKANTYYAIVGILTDTRCAAIRVRSSDFGNLGIGVPGEHPNP